MATLLIAMLFAARDLNLVSLVSRGFKHPLAPSIARAIRGFVVAILAIAILFGLALAVGGGGVGNHEAVIALIPKYFLSAIAIAFIEEAFFRAFLLGGMSEDFGNRVRADSKRRNLRRRASRAIPSALLRNRLPARGWIDDARAQHRPIHQSRDRDPNADRPVSIRHRARRSIYPHGQCVFLDRLHCGFVLGAKMWPKIILNRAAIPWWIAGGGAIPLVAGAVAWVIAIAIFSTLRAITGVQKASPDSGVPRLRSG